MSANMPDIGSDQGPRQPMLQANRCVRIIRPKHLDKGHWKDLEIQRPWDQNHANTESEIVPVIVDELALISKGMQYNLGKISGAININELQKIRLRNIQRSC